jgi:hypothetical protein
MPKPNLPRNVHVLRRADAARLGLKRSDLVGMDRPFRGIYLPSDNRYGDRVEAALAFCPPGSVATDLTGLALAGVRLPYELSKQAGGAVHVWVPASHCGPVRPGITVHRTRRVVPVWGWVGSVPVAHPAACWASLVARLMPSGWGNRQVLAPWRPALVASMDPARVPDAWVSAHRRNVRSGQFEPIGLVLPGRFPDGPRQMFLDLVVLGDALMRRHKPMLGHDEFITCLDSMAGSAGIAVVRAVASHLRPGTDSNHETWTRLIVVDAGFPVPTVNLAIRNAEGRVLRYLDLAWEEYQVDLEFQGRQHFDDPYAARRDMDRRNFLHALGWTVLETSTEDLRSPDRLIARLAVAFEKSRPAVR